MASASFSNVNTSTTSHFDYSHAGNFVQHFEGNMSWEPHEDSYRYTYPCGHFVKVGANKILRSGGHTAPPICPTCNEGKLRQRMKVEKWNVGNYFVPIASAPEAWLDSQLERVMEKAWA